MSSQNNNQHQESFDQWCVLELFGHQRLAGKVTQAPFGNFLRVDVPDSTGEKTICTKFYNPQAIYSISPVDKEIAVAVATRLAPEPVSKYELKNLLPERNYPSDDAHIERDYIQDDEDDLGEDEDL